MVLCCDMLLCCHGIVLRYVVVLPLYCFAIITLVLLCCHGILLQSPSAYVLFYERRIEGRRSRPVLDRSLSQSFAEEKKLLSSKYKSEPNSSVPEEPHSDDVRLYQC